VNIKRPDLNDKPDGTTRLCVQSRTALQEAERKDGWISMWRKKLEEKKFTNNG